MGYSVIGSTTVFGSVRIGSSPIIPSKKLKIYEI